MKKLIYMCLTIFVFIGVITSQTLNGYCEEPIQSIFEEQLVINSSDKFNLDTVIKNSELNPKEILFKYKEDLGRKELNRIKDINDLSYGEPYKVKIVDESIINKLANGEHIETSIENAPYYWEIPVLDRKGDAVASFIVDFFEGKWQVVEVGGFINTKDIKLSSEKNLKSKILKDKKIYSANSIAHLRFTTMNMDSLYINTDNKEYFIPMSSNYDKLYGFENRKIYDRDNFESIVKNDIQNKLLNNENLDLGTSVVSNGGNYSVLVSIICMIVGVLSYKVFSNKKIN